MKYFLFLCSVILLVSCWRPKITPGCDRPKINHTVRELALNESVTIIVCAVDAHDSSGIMLKKGNEYKFEVTPDTMTWKDGDNLKPFTADGKLMLKMHVFHLYKRMPSVILMVKLKEGAEKDIILKIQQKNNNSHYS